MDNVRVRLLHLKVELRMNSSKGISIAKAHFLGDRTMFRYTGVSIIALDLIPKIEDTEHL